MTEGQRIAYVLKGFPRLSETFIANEVRHLTRLGLSLGLFSIKRGDALAEDAALPDIHYLPAVSSLSETTLRQWLSENLGPFVACQRFWLRRSPIRYLRTMFFAGYCGVRYRHAGGTAFKKSFVKEFLFACYVAREIADDSTFAHIHAHFCHDAATVAWMASRLTGLPFSFTAHAKDIYQRRLNPGNLLERKLAASTFAVTCTNTNVDFLRDRSSVPDKIHGIYHGLDIRQFSSAANCIVADASQWKTEGRLLAIGRHVEKKGFTYLVEACRTLRDRGVSFRLDLIGEQGDQSAGIERAIESFGLQDRIFLHAPRPQNELVGSYRQADLFVLPCIVLDDGDRDGIPNVVAEAMACEVPVVVTGISGIPELVQNDVNGVIVPGRDALALADAIERLLADPDTRRALGAAARQTIEDRFDARTTHIQLRSIFDHALNGAARVA